MSKITLQQIKAMDIWGDAYHDQAIFDTINKFVLDNSNSFAERAEALTYMATDVMNVEDDREQYESDQEFVEDYLEFIQ